MRSAKVPIIEVSFRRTGRGLPLYIIFAHRHLQKELPTIPEGKEVSFSIPTDLLKVMGIDEKLIDQIDSLELTYGPEE